MKKLIIFILLPLVLIIGAGAGAFFFGLLPPGLLGGDSEMAEQNPAEEEDLPPPAFETGSEGQSFYMLDEFVANLQSERREPIFLLLSLSIEIPTEEARGAIQASEPRIRDSVILYLSSLDPNQLSGYDGIQKVRRDLWVRLRKILDPTLVKNIQILKLTVK